MAQCSSPRLRRALIVEDELMIALDLEDAMSALGFDICSLASTADTARSIAMDHQPDVVLMDVNLDGGHEGIEAGRWLREVCDVPVVFVTAFSDEGTIERIHEQVPGSACPSKAGLPPGPCRCRGGCGLGTNSDPQKDAGRKPGLLKIEFAALARGSVTAPSMKSSVCACCLED